MYDEDPYDEYVRLAEIQASYDQSQEDDLDMECVQLLETINDMLDSEMMTAEQIIETLVFRMYPNQLDSANAELVAISYNNRYQPVD